MFHADRMSRAALDKVSVESVLSEMNTFESQNAEQLSFTWDTNRVIGFYNYYWRAKYNHKNPVSFNESLFWYKREFSLHKSQWNIPLSESPYEDFVWTDSLVMDYVYMRGNARGKDAEEITFTKNYIKSKLQSCQE